MKSVLKIFNIIFIFYKCSRIEVKIFSVCISSAGKSLPYKPEFLRYSIYAFFIDSNSSMISCSGAFVSKLTTTMKMQATINAGSNS